jgi:hypothetical protein
MAESVVTSTLEYTSTGSLRSKLPAAKWGAACAACATAKAKCIRSNPDVESKCDRYVNLLGVVISLVKLKILLYF